MNQESGIKNSKTLNPKSHKLKADGFGLIEILVSSAVITVSLVALVVATQLSYKIIAENSKKVRAEFLAEEGVEAARTMRDQSWSSNISARASGTSYYPLFATSTNLWSLNEAGSEPLDGIFTPTITLEDVYRRNSDDAIVSSTSPESKTLDQGTREVISKVLWGDGKEVEIRTYITDLFQN